MEFPCDCNVVLPKDEVQPWFELWAYVVLVLMCCCCMHYLKKPRFTFFVSFIFPLQFNNNSCNTYVVLCTKNSRNSGLRNYFPTSHHASDLKKLLCYCAFKANICKWPAGCLPCIVQKAVLAEMWNKLFSLTWNPQRRGGKNLFRPLLSNVCILWKAALISLLFQSKEQHSI